MSNAQKFENAIASFFGAPFAVSVDSCTHGIELCLRYLNVSRITVPRRTYISIPMLAYKLGITLEWVDTEWQDYYSLGTESFRAKEVFDAAVLWKPNSYLPGKFMCLSFQYQKHLSLGRGGMILCPDKDSADTLKRMSYDGRLPNIPWREQDDILQPGYHYYLIPELAELGLKKLDEAIKTPPRIWQISDWPDISSYSCFKNK